MIVNTAAVSEINLAIVDGALSPDILERLISLTVQSLADLGALTHDHPAIERGHVGSLAAAVGAAFRPLYRQYFARGTEHLPAEAS